MELSGDLLCPQGFRDPVFFRLVWAGCVRPILQEPLN